MHIIATSKALDGVADPSLRPILDRYCDLMDLAVIYIIQPGDTADTLHAERGRPFAGWEFIHDHGGWYEAVFIISDDGAGDVILVPDHPGIDPELLTVCRRNAVDAEGH
jgi:hypothetical protein